MRSILPVPNKKFLKQCIFPFNPRLWPELNFFCACYTLLFIPSLWDRRIIHFCWRNQSNIYFGPLFCSQRLYSRSFGMIPVFYLIHRFPFLFAVRQPWVTSSSKLDVKWIEIYGQNHKIDLDCGAWSSLCISQIIHKW